MILADALSISTAGHFSKVGGSVTSLGLSTAGYFIASVVVSTASVIYRTFNLAETELTKTLTITDLEIR
jgi:hypothetical protein